jgi:hypothetical protein
MACLPCVGSAGPTRSPSSEVIAAGLKAKLPGRGGTLAMGGAHARSSSERKPTNFPWIMRNRFALREVPTLFWGFGGPDMTDSLSGLMKWLRRDEWREAFDETFDRHVGRACAKAEVILGELPEIIGEHAFANLWGCAFEDLLARDLDEGRNIVDDYLKRRGWKENASSKAYMRALRSAVMSVYEVSDIVPGESFLARDLVRGGEPVRVAERSATRSLKCWDRIAARIVRVNTKTVMAGGVLPFDYDASEAALEALKRAEKEARANSGALICELGHGGDSRLIASLWDDNTILGASAFLFTTIWLHDLLQKTVNPVLPKICNSDGDELRFLTAHYPLKQGTTAQAIRGELGSLSQLRQASDTFWNWVAPGNPPARNFTPDRDEPGGQTFTTTLDDGSLVLGTVEVKERSLILAVNSQSRLDRARAVLDPALNSLVGAPLIETQTVEQLMASKSTTRSRSRPTTLSFEDERTIVHASLERHYGAMLDEPIPMLGDLTPRKAARTKNGRDKVVAWLKFIENQSAQHGAGNPIAEYDFGWLWERLGVAELRH